MIVGVGYVGDSEFGGLMGGHSGANATEGRILGEEVRLHQMPLVRRDAGGMCPHDA